MLSLIGWIRDQSLTLPQGQQSRAVTFPGDQLPFAWG